MDQTPIAECGKNYNWLRIQKEAFINESFHGYIQGDAYSGHDGIMNRPGVKGVGCFLKEATRKALNYLANQWERLTRYLEGRRNPDQQHRHRAGHAGSGGGAEELRLEGLWRNILSFL